MTGTSPADTDLGGEPSARAVPRDIELVVDGDHAVVWAGGAVDLTNAERLVVLGRAALSEPRVTEVVLDLGAVHFMDSTGLGALVELRNRGRSSGKRVALRAVPAQVSRLLDITGLDAVFGVPTGDAGRC